MFCDLVSDFDASSSETHNSKVCGSYSSILAFTVEKRTTISSLYLFAGAPLYDVVRRVLRNICANRLNLIVIIRA